MAQSTGIKAMVLLSTIFMILASMSVQGAPVFNETIKTTVISEKEIKINSTDAVPTSSPDSTQEPDEISSGEGIGDETSQLSVSEAAERTVMDASEVGNAAYLTYSYILTNYLEGEIPAPASPCFSEERTAHELDGHIHPNVNYLQRLVQDHASLTNYLGYLSIVEEEYNSTLNKKPVCGYCVRFNDLMTLTTKLMTSVENLIRAVDPDAFTSTQAQDGKEKEMGSTEDDPCYQVCYDQQARTYLRYQAFAAVYIVNDVNGLLEQKLDSKKN